jgi:hypothetical protein
MNKPPATGAQPSKECACALVLARTKRSVAAARTDVADLAPSGEAFKLGNLVVIGRMRAVLVAA